MFINHDVRRKHYSAGVHAVMYTGQPVNIARSSMHLYAMRCLSKVHMHSCMHACRQLE